MEGDSLEIRPFRWNDLETMVQMVCDVWELENMYGTREKGLCMAESYLLDCMRETSFAMTAVTQKKVCGFVLGRREGASCLEIPRDWSGREEAAKDRESIEEYKRACRQLLRECGREYGGELILFVVAREWQGRGIGQRLYGEAVDYLRESGCSSYFLYTDSSCNYRFYDRRGMRRIGEALLPAPKGRKQLVLYLYEETI